MTELELEVDLESESENEVVAEQFAGAATPRPSLVLDRFGFDQFVVSPQHHILIQRLANLIVRRSASRYPVRQITIVGHTDSRGSATYNVALGQRRADAVRNLLVATIERLRPGLVQQIHIQTGSLGVARPVVPSTTPDGRARNRRVEIFLGSVRPSILPLVVVERIVRQLGLPLSQPQLAALAGGAIISLEGLPVATLGRSMVQLNALYQSVNPGKTLIARSSGSPVAGKECQNCRGICFVIKRRRTPHGTAATCLCFGFFFINFCVKFFSP